MRQWKAVGRVVLALLVGIALPGVGGAQNVEFAAHGAGLPSADAALKRVLKRGNYRLLTRDTLVATGEVIGTDVVVIRATVRVEGRINGDVIAVQSDIFARPGARFHGTVTVMAGGFYGSSLAQLSAPAVDASRFAYEVEEQEGGAWLIRAPGARGRFELRGLYGFQLPSYERVNAVTLPAGVGFRGGSSTWLPDANLQVRYRSARERVDGELSLEWEFSRHVLEFAAGRTVRSNDTWMNGAIENSLYSFIGASDSRNYYEADFLEGALRLEYGSRVTLGPGLIVAWEEAKSLEGRDPFSVFSFRGGFQDNLPVNELKIVSVRLQASLRAWIDQRTSLQLGASVERADADAAGDATFTLLQAGFSAEVPTLGSQGLVLEGVGQLPGSEGAPSQRWRSIGGWGSLPTLTPVARAGDHMWWTGLTYRIPLSRSTTGFDRVAAWLQYAAGNAWPDGGERPATIHNLALGVSLGPFSVGAYTNPGDDFETVLGVGLAGQRSTVPNR
jgi:hypothetical protein